MDSDSHISGGMTASAAVDRFFRRVLQDPALAPRFEGAELHRLAAQQRAFLAAALGTGYPQTPVTAGPGTEAAMAAHLAEALRDVGVPAATIEVIAEEAQKQAAQRPAAQKSAQLPATQVPAAPMSSPAPAPILPQVPIRPSVPTSGAMTIA
jgi:hemoglobin